MRSIWLSVLAVCATVCAAQSPQKIDPSRMVAWPTCTAEQLYAPSSNTCQNPPAFSVGTVTTGAPGTPAAVTQTGDFLHPVLSFTLPAGVPGTTTATGPNGDWVVPGVERVKLPRVDVSHPDFGAASGCANAADPNGVNDSTCAINAAIAWAEANHRGLTYPSIYFPTGTYKISSAIRVSACIHLRGDGRNASIIEQTNNSANGVTVFSCFGSPIPDLFSYLGSIEDLTIYAPGAHNYTATLLELNGTIGYTIAHVRLANSGGRGLATAGSTERLKVIDLNVDSTRWSVVAKGNELKFTDTEIAAPGSTSDGYCWDVNCINGVFPPSTWSVAQQLISASGNGTTATYVVRGGSNSGSTDGVSPMQVGNYFTVAGIADVTGLNGIYQINAVFNNSPISGEYTVTAANATSGTATVTGATYKPTLLPDDRSAAFWFAGATVNLLGGSIKANWHQGCFQSTGVFSGLIQGFYCEGFPLNGRPSIEPSLMANGLPPWTTTTGGIVSSAVPVASTLWFPDYVNDTVDLASSFANADTYRILPPDYVEGSTTISAFVPGVQQGQFENVTGLFSGDGQFHIGTRNTSGSTAPANTAWPSGSVIAMVPVANFGSLQVADNHFNDFSAPSANWAVDCNDTNNLICGESIVGSIPNGYTTHSHAGGGGSNVAVFFSNNETWGVINAANENLGSGFIKVSLLGQVGVDGGGSGTAKGETTEAVLGQFAGQSSNSIYAITEGDGSQAVMSASSPALKVDNTVPFFIQALDSSADTVLGANPSSSAAMGYQYAGSECWYDTPAAGGTHALNRFCAKGGPNNTGTSAGFEVDTWNGTAWGSQFSIPGDTLHSMSTSVGLLNGNFTNSTSSLTFNGPFLPNTDGFTYWSGTASVRIQCGWAYGSNTASTVTPTGITRIWSCNRNGALGVPLLQSWTLLPSGSSIDFSNWTTFKMPALATVGVKSICLADGTNCPAGVSPWSENVVTFSATPTLSATASENTITLTGNVTSSTWAAGTAGQQSSVVVCQNATGSFTFAWPANVRGGMTVGTNASQCSAQSFVYSVNKSAWLATNLGVINE